MVHKWIGSSRWASDLGESWGFSLSMENLPGSIFLSTPTKCSAMLPIYSTLSEEINPVASLGSRAKIGLGSIFKSFLVNFGVKAAQIDDRKLIRIA